jgi:TIR domain
MFLSPLRMLSSSRDARIVRGLGARFTGSYPPIGNTVLRTAASAAIELPADAAVEGMPLERQLLFISHANPQDNAAASWFATQLSLLGYEVWCDLKNTAAGESSFWLKVQKKIENDAAKFIFILSNTSRDFEKKPGVYKEVQAADNTKRDNFILPLRIEKLTGSVPIIIGPDLYINSENWAEGLRELQKRLIKDGVPRRQQPDYEKIISWWPAVSAHEAIVRKQPVELVTNLLPFISLPKSVHFIKVSSEGNLLSGRDQLKGALPDFPPYSVHRSHAISFASAADFMELTTGYDIADDVILSTDKFLTWGLEQLGIEADTAKNIVTYLTASSFEHFLEGKRLSSKAVGLSRRKIWFPAHSLIKNNKHSISELGERKTPVWFVGKVTHFRKPYFWHFGVQPTTDLRVHSGILLSPKAIISAPYRSDRGDKPIPLDEKRVLKKLNWWNKDWRTKIVAFAAWLADDKEVIHIPSGYQEIVVPALPELVSSDTSYLDKDDDALIKEILDWGGNASSDPA